jgi:hypothetical protein
MVAQVQVQDIVFPCVPWRIEGDDAERIEPVPGTWTLAPHKFAVQGIHGLLCCPNCKFPCLVRHDMGQTVNGCQEIAHFQCAKCRLLANLKLQEWDSRKMFCIAYHPAASAGHPAANVGLGPVMKEYTHALSREDAWFAFVTCNPGARLVDVGQVVGFFAKATDKDQKELSV